MVYTLVKCNLQEVGSYQHHTKTIHIHTPKINTHHTPYTIHTPKINFKCSQQEWNLWLNKILFHKLFYHALENCRWFSHKTSFIWQTACILLELKCYSDVFLHCDGDEHDKHLKVNPLHPNISIQILYTLLYIFLLLLTRRIC